MSGNRDFEKAKTLLLFAGAVLIVLLIVFALRHPQVGNAPPANGEHGLPQIQADDFERVVLQADTPVLVDFYAEWCGPCKQMEPILAELARENPRLKVVQVNVDENQDLGRRYDIEYLPSFLIFKKGELTARRSGKTDKTDLLALAEK